MTLSWSPQAERDLKSIRDYDYSKAKRNPYATRLKDLAASDTHTMTNVDFSISW